MHLTLRQLSLCESESGTRIAVKRFFEEPNVRIRTDMQMTSKSAKKHVVEAGLGPGIPAVHARLPERTAGALVVLGVRAVFGFPIGEDATDLMPPGHAA